MPSELHDVKYQVAVANRVLAEVGSYTSPQWRRTGCLAGVREKDTHGTLISPARGCLSRIAPA